MNGRRREDRLYTAIVMALLVALVVLGLLGVPALLVAAIGAGAATIGIVVFRRLLEGGDGRTPRRTGRRGDLPARYAPSVLEGSSVRRRIVHLRRRRHAPPPLRLR